jgi:hypothetical protein
MEANGLDGSDDWMEYPGKLILTDVRQVKGEDLKDATVIVASPPCTEYSYMAMPWSRAKQIRAALRGEGEFPEGYKGSRTIEELNCLFNECFRIQREASEAAGRYIPLIVENVRGAQEWVGRAAWNYGSFYLWGDVPALMPFTNKAHHKIESPHLWLRDPNRTGGKYTPNYAKVPGFRFDGSGKSFQTASVELSGTKQSGISGIRENGKGDRWFQDGAAQHGSRSSARKAASAMIAKIPAPLAQWIARAYKTAQEARA